jgi:hypothetical protein
LKTAHAKVDSITTDTVIVDEVDDEGKIMHLAKIAFEKFFIRNMKIDNPEPAYQKYIFMMLGIECLKKNKV